MNNRNEGNLHNIYTGLEVCRAEDNINGQNEFKEKPYGHLESFEKYLKSSSNWMFFKN